MGINEEQLQLNRTGFKRLVEQLGVKTGIIYHGQLNKATKFSPETPLGHLHLVRRGTVVIETEDNNSIYISKPTAIFFPRSTPHRIYTKTDPVDTDITCAEINYAIGQNNLLINSFEAVMSIELRRALFLLPLIDLIDREQQTEQLGGATICNQLMNVFVIYMLRHACEEKTQKPGVIALLIHKHFGGLVEQIFADITHPWQIECMAKKCHMSRASFAKQFKQVSGQTPNDFLCHVRIQAAMQGLQQGQTTQFVANQIGYSSVSALNKLFAKYLGTSPKQWLSEQIIQKTH
ncbi:MAG: AraC family transcriptional regulator [Glaciecola sp.]|jgi:AraC-like DNA-binding protein|nr:AraC family transcriptional regulator [Glaciecola sp.]MDG1816510.1 AraC family transcriptional regulator [Glaciecola sp.]MDG2098775.1 AraC family transcriptional regulator [Glaciecola sp.]